MIANFAQPAFVWLVCLKLHEIRFLMRLNPTGEAYRISLHPSIQLCTCLRMPCPNSKFNSLSHMTDSGFEAIGDS